MHNYIISSPGLLQFTNKPVLCLYQLLIRLHGQVLACLHAGLVLSMKSLYDGPWKSSQLLA